MLVTKPFWLQSEKNHNTVTFIKIYYFLFHRRRNQTGLQRHFLGG